MRNKEARDFPDGRMVAADYEGINSVVSRMKDALGRIKEYENLMDYVDHGPLIVADHVQVIRKALLDADAFDVIELMRMYETPMVLEGYRESLANQLPAAVELIALILLARGQRKPVETPTNQTRPAGLISDLHNRASEMLALGSFALLSSGTRNKFGPLTSLSAQYVSHDLTVRCKQYSHIQDEINEALFSSSHLDDLLLETIGFSYEDFSSVREAIRHVHSKKFHAIRDNLSELFKQRVEKDIGSEFDKVVRANLLSLLEFPGKRATLTIQEIAETSGVTEDRAQSVLDRFTLPFDEVDDPVASVMKFLGGDSAFRSASLIKDADNNYIWIGKPIGVDYFRQIVEDALKKFPKKFARYEKRRAAVSEQLALKQLATLLDSDASYANLKYFRANPDIEVSELGPESEDITSIAEQTESDGLFIIEDVAICVEVKAKSISSQARKGNVQRLSADLRATVGNATDQALRLENHIQANCGLWLESREWLDLSYVREVRSVTVFLDDFGPLSTALDELVRGEVLGSDRFPWLVTLHDLSVIAEIIDRPAEFLLYLRRRTESDVALKFSAIDELDLFMLFLSGGLWVEPDPDRVCEEYLGVASSTRKERRRYQESALPTRVMTQTERLDAWMYFQENSSMVEAGKPSFAALPDIARIVDFLNEGHKPGWFRFSADLLNLAEESQEQLGEFIEDLVLKTQKDGQYHNSVMALAGAWGYPTLFIGTKPPGRPIQEASSVLEVYGVAKKHQLQSDRALMVVIDEEKNIRSIRYDNSLPTESRELDDLVAKMGLIPPDVMKRRSLRSVRRVIGWVNQSRRLKKSRRDR